MNLLWKLSFRNLLRNRRRSLTTGIAVTAGFVGLSLLGGYIFRVQNGLQANTVYINLQGHLQIHRLGGLDKYGISPKKYLIDPELDLKLQEVLAPFANEIEFKGKFLTGSGLLIADHISQPFVARGAELEIFYRALHHPVVKKWARGWTRVTEGSLTSDKLTRTDVISITPRIAEILGRPKDLSLLKEDQKSIQLVTRTFENDLNAVSADLGMMHTTGVQLAEDSSVRTSLKLLQDLFATESYQYISLFLKDPDQASQIKKRIQTSLQNQQLPLEVFHFTEGAIGEFYVGTMNFLYVMAIFFVVLICGMVSLSIINSLTLGILERIKELGTLKALGFSSQQIVQLFVRETIWLCFICIAVGVSIAQIVMTIVNSANIRFSPPGIEGDIQFTLAPDLLLYVVIAFTLSAVAIITAYFVSKGKLKASAISLLSESGV